VRFDHSGVWAAITRRNAGVPIQAAIKNPLLTVEFEGLTNPLGAKENVYDPC
jgi:hypothetical protein